MKEAREVIAGELFRLLMEGEGMRSDDDADSILSALDAAGYVVVPKEPTEAMLYAGEWYCQNPGPAVDAEPERADMVCRPEAMAIYRDMIAASSSTKAQRRGDER